MECWKFRPISWRVYDGDTLMDLEIDLGFNIHLNLKTRLMGINAPEIRGESKVAGRASRDYLRAYLEQAQESGQLRVESHQEQGKYGRWLITLWDGDVNINDHLVQEGHAVYREY